MQWMCKKLLVTTLTLAQLLMFKWNIIQHRHDICRVIPQPNQALLFSTMVTTKVTDQKKPPETLLDVQHNWTFNTNRSLYAKTSTSQFSYKNQLPGKRKVYVVPTQKHYSNLHFTNLIVLNVIECKWHWNKIVKNYVFNQLYELWCMQKRYIDQSFVLFIPYITLKRLAC